MIEIEMEKMSTEESGKLIRIRIPLQIRRFENYKITELHKTEQHKHVKTNCSSNNRISTDIDTRKQQLQAITTAAT
jgi:hypothetical protein